MKRSVVTYTCDNNCGTTANVEHISANNKNDTPLPDGWRDLILLDNFGPVKGMGGQYCPNCIQAIQFALMEVKLVQEEEIIPAETPKIKTIEVIENNAPEKAVPPSKPTSKMIADILQKNVDINKVVDVSTGVEDLFGVTRLKFNHALRILKDEGYLVQSRKATQIGSGRLATLRVLTTSNIRTEDLMSIEVYPVEVMRKKLKALTAEAK
jgi:hypothetical protein